VRVHFTNLGCKLNQAEIERFGREFVAAGHQLAAALDDADLHVVNSCTVTHVAARASRKAAGRGLRSARDGSRRQVRTVLTGCYATAEAAAAAALNGVDLVVLNRDKERLLDRVHAAFPDLAPTALAAPAALTAPTFNTRALLKVEDGCDMRCAFCIIPLTRGRQRSRPLGEVVAEARQLVRRGHRELVVTGVQISAWRERGRQEGESETERRSMAPQLQLPLLIHALLAALPPQGARLRLTSIAPWQVDERLLEAWSDRRLCRHLHLSLQSGSTATLRRMRRPYSAESYGRLLERVRAAIPGVAVTTDVIVGFPGETGAEFAESLAAVAAMGFAKVHVFPFSPRPGTAAAALPAAVAAGEQRQRMARMLAAAESAERDFWRSHLGKRETVLWERPKEGRGHGLTGNYIRVWSDGAGELWNSFSEVELVGLEADGKGVTGRIASSEQGVAEHGLAEQGLAE
jgi:threonylcarbamoyladenosine tRNA methylthiotransferase MtaB